MPHMIAVHKVEKLNGNNSRNHSRMLLETTRLPETLITAYKDKPVTCNVFSTVFVGRAYVCDPSPYIL
jgi:hypothetical protein